jgi:succinyl-diaminopimelate desuccinylase
MEMALRECGTIRILFAAFISAIGKLFGRRGWFYNIAGEKARAIDGPCDYAIPPYNEYVVLGPKDPEETARAAAKTTGIPQFCIVDLNDLGGNILGVSSDELKAEWLLPILKDNPLGQTDEQTPIGIIRRAGGKAHSSKAWFEANLEHMAADLRRLIAINSVADTNSEIKPFGQGCRDVLDEMMKICEEHGIKHQNHEYYCGSAFLPGEGEREIGIYSHLDIVPVSGEWKHPAFGGEIENGVMYGRGVVDNKSAAILGLYTMLYFRENNIKLNSGIRLFFGCCEEAGMDDLDYYREHIKIPEYNLIADTVFPVGYGEKGIANIRLVSPEISEAVIGFEGGLVVNMVPDRAVLTLKASPELLEKLKAKGETEYISIESKGAIVELTASGEPAHSAHPEGARNAIGVLAGFAAKNELVTGEDQKAFAFIAEICGETMGEALGIAASHEEFGALTCVGSMLRLEDRRLAQNVNIRYPYSEKADVLAMVVKARCVEHGFSTKGVTDSPPSYVSRESGFVKALSESYREITGDDAPDYIMSGGTYARLLPNAVAFGPEPAGESKPAGQGGPHEPDEALNLKDFVDGCQVYAAAVSRIDALQ